jgi:hypothetical protein
LKEASGQLRRHAGAVVGHDDLDPIALVAGNDPNEAALLGLERLGRVEDEVEQGVLEVSFDPGGRLERGVYGELEPGAGAARIMQVADEEERLPDRDRAEFRRRGRV